MGVGGKKPPMKEIDDTRSAGRDEAFENIIKRITTAGGEITRDDSSPLFIEMGANEFEIGSQRIVEFNLNRFDFQLTRRVETQSIQGEGHQKHLSPLSPPRIKLVLKRKPQMSQDWQVMDLEDML